MKRRSFLKVVGSAAGGAALTDRVAPAAEPTLQEDVVNGMPRRVLGRTGQKVSIVGFPGLALVHHEQKQCTEGLHAAYDQGVNYFDVAPAYGNGACETKMGVGLEGIPRDKIFLACKTKKRDKDGARQELEASLKLLKTDHFDLYQLHHLVRPEDDSKRALADAGAMETILKAKEEGKIRHIGFSAHTTKAALEALNGFNFDTVMFPINFVELYTRGMGKEVLELAKEKGAAVLSIKTMSKGGWPQGAERTRKWWYRAVEETDEVDLAWRWTLSQPGVVAGFPPAFLDLLEKGIAACKRLRPITAEETAKLEEMAKACTSIFLREESSIAGHRHRNPLYPECAYASMEEADV
jgi:predicted aldo/keto reductase-like oxidoreductase